MALATLGSQVALAGSEPPPPPEASPYRERHWRPLTVIQDS